MSTQSRNYSPYTRARNALIRSTVMSPQSLTIVLVAVLGLLLGIGVAGLSPAFWAVFGVIGVLAYMLATMSDPAALAEMAKRLFVAQYNPADIRNTRARQRLQQGLEYMDNIQKLGAQQGGAMRVQIEATVSEINDWVAQIYKVARRIDLYEENALINRDRARVPDEIKSLRLRLDTETDPHIRAGLEDSIRLKETQLENLKALANNIKRAHLQLDNTVTALGTIFAQVQLLDAKEVDGRRTHRLRQEIHDEVLSLKDTIEALDEVQGASVYSSLAS
ncbi:MAG: hypothetical protein GYB66_13305 [Chloroflexi bacterium]|nr:hypothetical protein [Chloroflexota bacterium]